MGKRGTPRQFNTQVGPYMINIDRFNAKVGEPDPVTGCQAWLGVKNNIGYPFMGVRDIVTDKPKMATAHRVALMIKLGRPIAPGMNANHSCHRRDCVAPDHLYEGTQAEKIAAMNRDGLHVNNGRQPREPYMHKQAGRVYKYSEEEITWIRNATVPEISVRYNLESKKAASFRCQIRTGYKWLPWEKK